MLNMVARLGANATTHGFRSTFRTWADELMGTKYSREVKELALAHIVGNATERAYARSDALEQRRDLMNDWAAYCARPPQGQQDQKVTYLDRRNQLILGTR
jgi:integrase